MSDDSSPPFSLRFNLGRIPVVVEPMFWVMTVLLGLGFKDEPRLLVCWMAVVFVSILVHELGHALMALALGSSGASIRLYSFGGLCYHQGLGRWRDVAISFAGPLAGFLFAGALYLARPYLPLHGFPGVYIYRFLMYVNVYWGLMNLLPVHPLDGGNMVVGILGPTRYRMALGLGVFTAIAVVAYALATQDRYLAVLFGVLGLGCFQRLSTAKDLKPLKPVKVAELEPDALARAWQALRSGNESEAARLGHLALSAAKPGEESNAARDLLAWVALADGNARAALSHLEKVQPPEAARPYSLAIAYEAAGLPERALPHALAALRKEPTEAVAALAVRLLVGAQRLDEAERTAREFAWKTPGRRDALLADVASARGDFAAAAALHVTAFEATRDADRAYRAARDHARAGQGALASEWLRRALDAGYDDFETLGQETALAEVLSAPEFAERLARHGKGAA
jgi:Zn-dependent protease